MRKDRGLTIAGNWKMNHSSEETAAFFTEFRALSASLSPDELRQIQSGQVKVCIAPPTLSLQKAQSLISYLGFPVTIAAQNAHWEKKGAFTGEISGPMLQEIGVQWALVGHSERRQLFGETDKTVRMRAESLLDQGFQIILCIGETRTEREKEQTREVLIHQITEAIPNTHSGIAKYLDGRVLIAYEPVWAIGTGLTATPEQAEEAHAIIRDLLLNRFGVGAASRTPLLYGGSVTPENIGSLLACSNVDGALVGGASLKPQSFLSLLRTAAQT